MKNYKEVKFLYTNADSLNNKMTELKTRIATEKPDIIAVVETWFQEEPLNKFFFPSECLNIAGYNSYRYDNSEALKGGIILLITPEIDGGPCKELKDQAAKFEESAWHWINIGKEPSKQNRLLFGCKYRKGASSVQNNNNLMELLSKATKLSEIITVCGDFNHPTIDWINEIVNAPEESEAMLFYDGIQELFLDQKMHGYIPERGVLITQALLTLFSLTINR